MIDLNKSILWKVWGISMMGNAYDQVNTVAKSEAKSVSFLM